MKLAVFLVCYVLYIVQLHAQSTVDWVQTLGGSGEDRSEKIAVDGASNVYSIGYFRDTIGNLHSFGGADVLLTKHNADGQLLWMKQFGSIDEDKGNDIAIDKHGNIYICGEYRNGPLFYTGDSLNSAGTFDGFVAKLDTAGTILWIEAIQSAANELATAIACDTSGNVYVGGTFQSSLQFQQQTLTGYGALNNFLIKIDHQGTLLWQEAMSTPITESIQAIEVGPFQDVYVVGSFRDVLYNAIDTLFSVSFHDIFLAKYSASGQFDYWKGFGGASSDYGYALVLDTASIYMAGVFEGMVNFDNQTLNSTGELDVCLLRCSFDGTVEWVQNISGLDDSRPLDLALDASSVWMVGYYDGLAWSGQDSIYSRDSRHVPSDVFLAQFQKNGQSLSLFSYGGAQLDFGSSIAIRDSSLYLAGVFRDSAYFDSILVVSQNASADVFVLKLITLATSIGKGLTGFSYKLNLFPNPAKDIIQLHLSTEKSSDFVISLVSVDGRVLDQIFNSEASFGPQTIQYSVENLCNGLYYFVFKTIDGQIVLPFVKS